MAGPLRSTFAALALAILLALPSAAGADTGETPVTAAQLTGHTLIWPDAEGTNQFVHLGRFGDFDRYVPCTIESGGWTLEAGRILHLDFINPAIASQAYALTRRDDGRIALARPDGETFVAELADGDRMPWP